jgi:DNA-binding winged helix-turn-helix (wHTH) protein
VRREGGGVTTVGSRVEQPAPDQPQLDQFGVLRYRGGWISLSPVQEAIMRSLLARFAEPVSRADVAAAAWPGNGAGVSAINIHIYRLRPRLRDLGLVIHTLRGRGFLLESLDAD